MPESHSLALVQLLLSFAYKFSVKEADAGIYPIVHSLIL